MKLEISLDNAHNNYEIAAILNAATNKAIDNYYELTYEDFPVEAQVYFSYLDVEEREVIRGRIYQDSDMFKATFEGDHLYVYGDSILCSPDNDVWFPPTGVSIKHELILQAINSAE